MPAWLLQAIKTGRKVPWAKLWAVMVWLVTTKQRVDRLPPEDRNDFYRLVDKGTAGSNKLRPWRNLTPAERARLWALTRKAVGLG